MTDSKQIVYNWPGGMNSVAGGTRTEIKLSRPWQQDIVVNPAKCPLCLDLNYHLEYFEENGGWYLRANRYTPYAFHRMVIPATCWPKEELRTLGGRDKIETAFKIITREIEKNPELPINVNVHIGALAGQNISHLHYHVVQYCLDKNHVSVVAVQLSEFYRDRQDLVVINDDVSLVGVGGVRAGQCFILPQRSLGAFEISSCMDNLVILYNNKFKSKEGLPPDFAISLYFKNGDFMYGVYTPILNHWGGAEYFALYESVPVTLPWPQELTAEYLRS